MGRKEFDALEDREELIEQSNVPSISRIPPPPPPRATKQDTAEQDKSTGSDAKSSDE